MKGLSYVLFLLLALGCGVAFADGAAELVTNPGFESGTNDWGLFVPDDSMEKHCQFTISNDHPHSGSACAELNSGDFARFAIGHKPVLVTPGGVTGCRRGFGPMRRRPILPRHPWICDPLHV